MLLSLGFALILSSPISSRAGDIRVSVDQLAHKRHHRIVGAGDTKDNLVIRVVDVEAGGQRFGGKLSTPQTGRNRLTAGLPPEAQQAIPPVAAPLDARLTKCKPVETTQNCRCPIRETAKHQMIILRAMARRLKPTDDSSGA